MKFFCEIQFRKKNLPLQQKSFNDVMDEYVKLTQMQYEREQLDKINTSRQEQTSIHMLRQIKRVVKFLHEYCGKKAVDKIDNAMLQDYVAWWRDYYHRMPKENLPKNSRINPADKILEWEVTLPKFATERGYRGKMALPTWRFKSEKRIVRPAFVSDEMTKTYLYFRNWIREVPLKDQ